MDRAQSLRRDLSTRSRSRPRSSRNSSVHSAPYLPQGGEELLLSDGGVSEETVELLQDFVHPHQHDERRDVEETLVGESSSSGEADTVSLNEELEDWEALKSRPWYRRPAPWWILLGMPIGAIAMSCCVAPRVEVYTQLVCRSRKPDYTTGKSTSSLLDFVSFYPGSVYPVANGTISDPVLPFHSDQNGDLQGLAFDTKHDDYESCASDPEVQAEVAKLIAVLTSTMGILGCLTTAWWGSLSDRHGRLRVLGINIFGLLLNDVNFIFVSTFFRRLPGGYWFLLLGPIVEGSLGGMTSSVAAVHAYIADCTSPDARSRTFSVSVGLLFIGFALGPTLGGLLIRATHYTLSVFYLATILHFVYAIAIWTILPESLAPSVMNENRRKRSLADEEARREEHTEAQEGGAVSRGLCLALKFKRLFSFLSPLSIFAPRDVETNVTGKHRKDWNLALIATAFGFSALVVSSYQYKFQYAAAAFEWTSEELGYWLSVVGASRAVYLAVVLPIVIKIFLRKKQAVQLPVEPGEPLNVSSISDGQLEEGTGQQERTVSPERPIPKHPPHTPTFDLWLARFSAGLEFVCYTVIAYSPSPMTFVIFGVLASWGGGFNPAIQALALELHNRRNGNGEDKVDTGRLFGALSVVQVMTSQIIGPAVFGLTYMKTVATYPKTIFFMSSASIGLALLSLSFVRLPEQGEKFVDAARPHESVRPQTDREATLIDLDDEVATGSRKMNNKNSTASAV